MKFSPVFRAGKLLGGLAVAGAYLWAMRRRNRGLEPPGMRGLDGAPFPEGELVLSDGARITYVDVGEGPAVLMVPGADGVKETWRYQVPALARDHRVVAADLRSVFGPDTRFERFVRDLVELTDALDLGPAAVMGQSLGGPVSMRYALDHPGRVRALVLANTLARVSYDHVGLDRTLLAPVAMATVRYLPTPLGRMAARLWCREEVWIFDDSPGRENLVDYALFTGPRTVSPAVSSRRVDLFRGLDLRPELPAIDVPVLVLKGPRDAYTPPEWCREIAARIPRASYVEIPDTGHCSHISRPGLFNRLVRDWLAGVESTPEPVGDAGAG